MENEEIPDALKRNSSKSLFIENMENLAIVLPSMGKHRKVSKGVLGI